MALPKEGKLGPAAAGDSPLVEGCSWRCFTASHFRVKPCSAHSVLSRTLTPVCCSCGWSQAGQGLCRHQEPLLRTWFMTSPCSRWAYVRTKSKGCCWCLFYTQPNKIGVLAYVWSFKKMCWLRTWKPLPYSYSHKSAWAWGGPFFGWKRTRA